jgi:hypothetical protein
MLFFCDCAISGPDTTLDTIAVDSVSRKVTMMMQSMRLSEFAVDAGTEHAA